MTKLIKDQRFKNLRVAIANDVLQDLAGRMSIDAVVVNARDEVGISTKGYRALYQLLRDCLCQKEIESSIFLHPKKLKSTKGFCNTDVIQILGKFYHFNDKLCIASWGKSTLN